MFLYKKGVLKGVSLQISLILMIIILLLYISGINVVWSIIEEPNIYFQIFSNLLFFHIPIQTLKSNNHNCEFLKIIKKVDI